jgi:Fe-Mn family superoxide dismutase
VYEHAYFMDFGTDRASYIEAFLANLDWGVVDGWVGQYGIPT